MPDSVSDSKSLELLNSSFYSSNSINTLDHARTFRNSLILKEMSDQSLNSSIKPNESFSGATEGSSVLQHSFKEGLTGDSEVQTVNMTTSPSLSALADILNERSKYADQKTRNAQNIESSIIEEEEDSQEQDNMYNHNHNVSGSRLGIPEEARGSLATSSPNLIDIDGFNNIQAAPSSSHSFEEPDFLSTPKVKSDFHKPVKKVHIQPTIVEQENSPPTKLENESTVHAEIGKSTQNIRPLNESSKPLPTPKKLKNPKVRSKKPQPRKYTDSSAQRTTSAGSVLEDTSVHKKKKSFFSFLKKKEPKATVNNNNDILNGRSRMSSSNTFSMKNQHPMKTPEKLKKKSHSSSSIFNSFLKGKNDASDSPGRESIRHKKHTEKPDETMQDLELTVDTNSISSIESPILRKNFDDAPVKADIVTKPIDQRKLTPLNMDILLGNEEREKGAEQKQQSSDSVASDDVLMPSKDNFLSLNYEAPSPAFSKHDTGEVLFPKFLDSHEVDSIVSLERTRSTKSNKRSSMNSQRRSLTDTLSIKAQSEGMFITEASSVVLSTPDLTKSPASSILKSGRFECQDSFSREFSYEGNTNEDHNAFLNIRNDNNLSKNNDVFLNSIEQKFDQLVMASDEEKTEVEKDIPKAKISPVKSISESQDLYVDDDSELISDIMEFASFINFGDDDISLDLDLGTTEAPYNPGKPTLQDDKNVSSPATFDTRNNQEPTRVTREPQPHIAEEERFAMYEDDHRDQSAIYQQDDGIIDDNDFEDEDFNNHTDAPVEVTPRINAYLPEFEANRPVSMSFKGLKAPRMNSSFIDSMTPNSPAKSDITSISETNAKDNTDEGVRFSSQIILYDTYGEFEYDRHPEVSTCNQLTPQLAQMIKLELNELKSVMEVHDDSRCYTHFY
ncbi:Bni4p [Saccharomyces eubayanus]|uniref:Bni4p n=1 Tax=Saccharomyces eubayanus TaxID=1080349 RepID=UPI0006C4B5CC|nr:BNI4-like protein [Saccharomyces eubayanus]KOG96941.1 BNI4-like protein [Saccharomyces eubayanus]